MGYILICVVQEILLFEFVDFLLVLRGGGGEGGCGFWVVFWVVMVNIEEYQNGGYVLLGDEEGGMFECLGLLNGVVKLVVVEVLDDVVLGVFLGSIKYLIWNEFCECFCFYGMKIILVFYLVQYLLLSENELIEFVYFFIVVCYVMLIIGVFLSDCVWVCFEFIICVV